MYLARGLVGFITLLTTLCASHGLAKPQRDWFKEGQAAAKQAADYQANTAKAKNIILFVGDGMGISTITASRILQGQLQGASGEENQLSFERFPNVALAKTYNTNQQTPDSAGTMTAMATGVKTRAGMLSVPDQFQRGECHQGQHELTTMVDLAERAGRATGIVTTAAITHATPAALYAHTAERGWQVDSRMTAAAKRAGCVDIARQLINYSEGDGIDVILGGGRRDFLPKTELDSEGSKGRRADGVNLIKLWLAQSDQHQYIENLSQFQRLKLASKQQVLGLFNSNHMQFEADRHNDLGGEPSLQQMTRFAIQQLQQRSPKQGFFLMVEAGRIDHGHHAGNAARALHDTIELSEAVAAALALVDLDNTLIIVTADHSHVMTMAGYPTRGNPILGLTVGNDARGEPLQQPTLDSNGKPYTTLAYANGPGYIHDCDVDIERPSFAPAALNYKQAATIPLGSETHGGEDVAIFAIGAGADAVRGVQEQHVIFHIMVQAGRF